MPALIYNTLRTIIDWDRTWTLVSHTWVEVEWVWVRS